MRAGSAVRGMSAPGSAAPVGGGEGCQFAVPRHPTGEGSIAARSAADARGPREDDGTRPDTNSQRQQGPVDSSSAAVFVDQPAGSVALAAGKIGARLIGEAVDPSSPLAATKAGVR